MWYGHAGEGLEMYRRVCPREGLRGLGGRYTCNACPCTNGHTGMGLPTPNQAPDLGPLSGPLSRTYFKNLIDRLIPWEPGEPQWPPLRLDGGSKPCMQQQPPQPPSKKTTKPRNCVHFNSCTIPPSGNCTAISLPAGRVASIVNSSIISMGFSARTELESTT